MASFSLGEHSLSPLSEIVRMDYYLSVIILKEH